MTTTAAADDRWYTHAAAYWSAVDATDDGMLGGFPHLSDIDARSSLAFLASRVVPRTPALAPQSANDAQSAHVAKINHFTACDCGSGIGRVTKNMLVKLFDKVDLVDQNPAFINQARSNFADAGIADRVDSYFAVGLQEFTPQADRYDLIWCQWVLGHLKDDDLVEFFIRCKTGLTPTGLIGIKENITKSGVIFDEVDNSCTRSDTILKQLFERAGLCIVAEAKQTEFPRELFGVKMYLLSPSTRVPPT